jgi:1-acyl-sn-glycerol-3-phosphate acyltransferase
MPSPSISTFTLSFFRRIARGYFRRHFRAIRISGTIPNLTGQLIIYANHSSWWDPMVSVMLAWKLLPTRKHFAPMDASALQRYGILKHIGIFPVEMNSARGAAQFLRTSLTVLAEGGVLWITPQGRFADNRERPLQFKPGLAALAARVPSGCTLLPLAIEYPFWDERLPEALLQFGTPIHISGGTAEEIEPRLKQALLETMETLQEKAIARNPAAFEILQQGSAGTGGFYSLGQRALAKLRRRPYQPDHTAAQDHHG